MKSNKGKGLLGLLGLLVVLGIFGFFGYDTLQKSKLVTDENGVTSQNGGIKLGLDLAGGVSVVNIDNGFGAGYLASMMNHMRG